MRPLGDVSTAILQAVQTLSTPQHGAVLREIAATAQVGERAAAWAMGNLVRYGYVQICGSRKVPWCTRAVMEYGVATQKGTDSRRRPPAAAANDADGGYAVLKKFWG